MTNDRNKPRPPSEEDGVTDHAASAVQDVVEDLLNLDEDEDPTPGAPRTSRG